MKDKEIKSLSNSERFFEIVDILKKHEILSGINPIKFRTILEELGPTFIKIGQILSNRSDLLPNEYIIELEKLRSDVSPMEYSEVLEILGEEYNTRLFKIFLKIDKNPVGSASIAQVHKATLLNGETVVVKVQRRDIKEKMISDIKLLKKALKILRVQKIFKDIVSFDDVLDELLATSLEEMNFLTEAAHIEEFNEVNKEVKYIRVPRVYKNLTTEKVLVMEYIEGISIKNHEVLINEGYDLEEIGSKLADNYIYQAIDMGFFHADPHPDNILIKDGKIVYVDYGMMGRLNNRNKEILSKCIVAIFNDNIREVERNLLILGNAKYEVNHSKLCKDIELILARYKTADIKDIEITKFATELISLLSSNGITLPKDITMLVRGIVVIEGTLEILSPNINLMQVFESRAKSSSLKDLLNKDNIMKEMVNVGNSIASLGKIPHDLHTFLKDASRGEAKFNIEVSDSNKQIDRFEKMVHRIVVCVLDVAFIVGAALIVANGVDTPEQSFLFYLYLIVGFSFTVWLFIKMYIDKLNRRK